MPIKDPIKAKEYSKRYYEAHREESKAYRQSHKEEMKAYKKAWNEAHREERKAASKAWNEAHRQESYEYKKSDLNSLGQTKDSIRKKSQRYLNKYGKKIPGYEIHHCCTYAEPYKFIYCSIEMHRLIHAYLRRHNINADSEHYEYIKHLLDDTAVKYNID